MTERRPVLRRTRPSRPARVARRAKGTDEHELILSTLEPNETPREATADFAKVSVEGADLITGTRGERAFQAFQEAANLDAIPRLSHGDEIVYAMEAEKARAKAQALLQLTDPVRLAAGEVIGGDHRIVDTLESPEAISAGASSRRMHAAPGGRRTRAGSRRGEHRASCELDREDAVPRDRRRALHGDAPLQGNSGLPRMPSVPAAAVRRSRSSNERSSASARNLPDGLSHASETQDRCSAAGARSAPAGERGQSLCLRLPSPFGNCVVRSSTLGFSANGVPCGKR